MAKLALAALVMRACRTDCNAHYFSRFCQAEIVIKDQLQGFPLAARQLIEGAPKQRLHLRAIDIVFKAAGGWRRGALGVTCKPQPVAPFAAAMIACRVAHD